jgi:hypothetical protein
MNWQVTTSDRIAPESARLVAAERDSAAVIGSHFIGWLPSRSCPFDHPSITQIEAAVMPGTSDPVAFPLSLTERPATVAAPVGVGGRHDANIADSPVEASQAFRQLSENRSYRSLIVADDHEGASSGHGPRNEAVGTE